MKLKLCCLPLAGLIALLVSACGSPGSASAILPKGSAISTTASQISDDYERENLFHWFDSLGGYSLLKEGQFVKIDRWATWSGKKEPTFPDYGFLKSGGGDTFTVLTPGLSEISATAGKTGEREEVVSCSPIDIKAWLIDQRKLWARPPTRS